MPTLLAVSILLRRSNESRAREVRNFNPSELGEVIEEVKEAREKREGCAPEMSPGVVLGCKVKPVPI